MSNTSYRRARILSGASLTALACTALTCLAGQGAHAAEAEENTGPAIVVTAAGYEQDITVAPASVTVLDREELQEKRFGSLAEALQDVQGVDVGGEAGKTGASTSRSAGCPATIR